MAVPSIDNIYNGINNYAQPVSVYASQEVIQKIKSAEVNLNLNFPSYQAYYNNFDRLYSIYTDIELQSLRQWVFFVRPECNIVNEYNPTVISNNCRNDRFMQYMVQAHNVVSRQLTMELTSNHDFMTFPLGRIESMQIPDLSIKNSTISQPYTNLLMPYGGNAWESKTGGTFDVTFREDSELRIHRLIQLWVHYIDCVSRGEFAPKDKYVRFNKIDYASSVYYVICAPNGEDILWWSKYTGVFPTSVPNSDLGFNLRGEVDNKVSVPFVYYYHESLNPDIMADFNRNAKTEYGNYTYQPFYTESDESLGSGNGIVGAPFISGNMVSGYKLRWKSASEYM